jgi:UDP:flavonoid glycosyltransferase YjiC (YdhE family)
MRALLSCSIGGSGHLMPLLDVAAALRRAGDECVLVVPRSLAQTASESGLRVVAGKEPPREAIDEIWARVRRGPRKQVVGLIDQELFADLATDALSATAESLCDEFRPDLVVRESCEYAASMSALRRSIPQAQVGVSASKIDAGVLEDVAPSLDRRCPGVSDAIRAAPYLTGFPAPLDPSPWRDTRRYRAATVERIGAGIVVRSSREVTGGVASLDLEDAGSLADAILAGLQNRAYREVASRIGDAIAATPTLDGIVRMLPSRR